MNLYFVLSRGNKRGQFNAGYETMRSMKPNVLFYLYSLSGVVSRGLHFLQLMRLMLMISILLKRILEAHPTTMLPRMIIWRHFQLFLNQSGTTKPIQIDCLYMHFISYLEFYVIQSLQPCYIALQRNPRHNITITLQFPYTNVTPIIRTHNILTYHNRTHNNPLEPIKKELYYYRFVSQQVTSENYYGNFLGWFSWDWCHNSRHRFFYGFADHILHPVKEKEPFWGHCWIKNESLVAPGS